MVSDSVEPVEGSTTEPFPILSYDTDVGFGYGAKVFMLNPFGGNESFDVTLFNSTKGERWYRFVCSVPDLEVRQGRLYPLAVDLVVDYDKYLKNSFFGVGNGSEFKSREYYTREPLEISLAFSSGFSRRAVGQIGLKYKSVRNFNFPDTSRLVMVSPALNSATARYHSLFASYRYDSRNSFVNPSRGWVLQAEGEFAPQTGLTNVQLGRLAGWVQYYSVLFYPKTVLALRLGMQGLIGNNVPVQMLLSIGGNQTLRGSPQDRYLDKTASISNAEVRFPIFWRFGGIIGYDAGKVWRELSDVSLSRWAANPVVGLRFFMETFVVRMDLGFGTETTGFYLNFGHLF
jgi:outer membrane protein assembly factor BamA